MRISKKVTVAQFQELSPILKKANEESDPIKFAEYWANIIAIVANCQLEEVEALPIDKLKGLISQLNWLVNVPIRKPKKYIWLDGRLYKATLSARKFSSAQFSEIMTWKGEGGNISQLHKHLATIYSPLTWRGFKHDGINHKKHAERFSQAQFLKVYPTVFFYSVRLKRSLKSMIAYGLKRVREEQTKALRDLGETLKEISETSGAGTLQSTK